MRPDTLPEMDAPRPSRRYQRPRSPISWVAVMLGLGLGIAAGLLYTWVLNPLVEFNTQPWQLRGDDRQQYMVAIALDYAHTSNLNRAVERLLSLRPQRDPFEEMAEVACDLATTGYANNNSGLRAVSAMMTLYQLQGRAGCADQLILSDQVQPTQVVQIDVPTPTLPPPATKTPTPESVALTTPTPTVLVVPTSLPQSDFEIINIPTFCSVDNPGVIEVNVVDFNGQGIAGQVVRARWEGGESRFATGLKPERNVGYADFTMEAGLSYIVDMPGRSDPSQPLTAVACTTEDGTRSVISYRVTFRLLG
jgi:hypothetical protein